MLKEFRAWLRGIRWIRNNLDGYEPSPDMLYRLEAAAMERKHNEVVSGSFLYYIVEEETNIRHTSDGVPMIYSNVDKADYDCNWVHEVVISVAVYNRMYGEHSGD